MSSDVAIRVQGLCKAFPIYRQAHHRLLQMLMPGPESRWYDEYHALRGVDLEIFRGETVGIVGRNGSGKSTLLQLICGTLTPSGGSIEVNGRIAALLELGAGFNPEFTGRENILLNGTVLGLTSAEIEERLGRITEFADIGGFIDQPVKTYSSGMYVRLAFAVAINVDPEILIVDEALSVGDEAFQRKCFARIDQIRDQGSTILFVSHSAGTVIDLCDRALLLDGGELLTQGKPKHVVSLYQKLLYAPEGKVAYIRDAIRADRIPDEPEQSAAAAPIHNHVGDSDAYWDDGLQPSSTVRYESRGASINDPHLETVDGRRVNVIAAGHEYVYRYRVHAHQTLTGVRCGMMIKTKTGVDVAGTATASPGASIAVVQAGAVLDVCFKFRCMLASGTYFLNAGVLAMQSGGEDFADRLLDGAMFRVLPDASRLLAGLVDLSFETTVTLA